MNGCLVSVRALLRPVTQLPANETGLRLLLLSNPLLDLFTVSSSLRLTSSLSLEVLPHLLDLFDTVSSLVLLRIDLGHGEVRQRGS